MKFYFVLNILISFIGLPTVFATANEYCYQASREDSSFFGTKNLVFGFNHSPQGERILSVYQLDPIPKKLFTTELESSYSESHFPHTCTMYNKGLYTPGSIDLGQVIGLEGHTYRIYLDLLWMDKAACASNALPQYALSQNYYYNSLSLDRDYGTTSGILNRFNTNGFIKVSCPGL